MADINVMPVWRRGIRGRNVTIAVTGHSVQFAHPDLRGRENPAGSADFNGPSVPYYFVGQTTSVAGLCCAEAENGVCGVGSSPLARLSNIRFNDAIVVPPAVAALALRFASDVNDVYLKCGSPLFFCALLVPP